MEGCSQKTNFKTTKLYLINSNWKYIPDVEIRSVHTFSNDIENSNSIDIVLYKQTCKQIYTDHPTVIITFKYKIFFSNSDQSAIHLQASF